MDEPYEELSLGELVTYGPPSMQLRKEEPELYDEADAFMDGLFSQIHEEWYPDFRDTVESYLDDEISVSAVQDIYVQVPTADPEDHGLEEHRQLQAMIGEDLYEQNVTWHSEVMDRLDISKEQLMG